MGNVCVFTHSVSAIGRHVVIVGRVSKLDSVLTRFGLTAQGALPERQTGMAEVKAEVKEKSEDTGEEEGGRRSRLERKAGKVGGGC